MPLATQCPRCRGTDFEDQDGQTICAACQTVIRDNNIVSDVQFEERGDGSTSVSGQFVGEGGRYSRFTPGSSRPPREATITNGRRRIQQLAGLLKIRQQSVDSAVRLFQLAVEANFTQGRKSQNVCAACLYIVCRRNKSPLMLIDFSDILQTNVFVLGQTFLRLCQTLMIHPPLIDPSLYIQRFAAQLEFGDKEQQVSNSALRLVQRMRRDWIEHGRRPAGICGAALLIAGKMHGFRRTQKEIIQVVKICDVTLRKRLCEFADTESAKLTAEQFEVMELEQEADPPVMKLAKKAAEKAEREKHNIVDPAVRERRKKAAAKGQETKRRTRALEAAEAKSIVRKSGPRTTHNSQRIAEEGDQELPYGEPLDAGAAASEMSEEEEEGSLSVEESDDETFDGESSAANEEEEEENSESEVLFPKKESKPTVRKRKRSQEPEEENSDLNSAEESLTPDDMAVDNSEHEQEEEESELPARKRRKTHNKGKDKIDKSANVPDSPRRPGKRRGAAQEVLDEVGDGGSETGDESIGDFNAEDIERELTEAVAAQDFVEGSTTAQRVRIAEPANRHREPEYADDGELHCDGINDDELDGYLNTEAEHAVKETLWNELNADYLKKLKEQEEAEEELRRQGKPIPKKKSYSRKNRPEFANAAEAVGSALARRAERDKNKSSKVNYSNLHLNNLFNAGAAGTPATSAATSEPVTPAKPMGPPAPRAPRAPNRSQTQSTQTQSYDDSSATETDSRATPYIPPTRTHVEELELSESSGIVTRYTSLGEAVPVHVPAHSLKLNIDKVNLARSTQQVPQPAHFQDMDEGDDEEEEQEYYNLNRGNQEEDDYYD